MSKDIRDILAKVTGFDWDKGNKSKSLVKHKVTIKEAEQVFINDPQIILEDLDHSQKEKRYTLLGITDTERKLAVTFTIRAKKIRIISARDQKRGAERRIYKILLEENYE